VSSYSPFSFQSGFSFFPFCEWPAAAAQILLWGNNELAMAFVLNIQVDTKPMSKEVDNQFTFLWKSEREI
jgi:hypothetical protein